MGRADDTSECSGLSQSRLHRCCIQAAVRLGSVLLPKVLCATIALQDRRVRQQHRLRKLRCVEFQQLRRGCPLLEGWHRNLSQDHSLWAGPPSAARPRNLQRLSAAVWPVQVVPAASFSRHLPERPSSRLGQVLLVVVLRVAGISCRLVQKPEPAAAQPPLHSRKAARNRRLPRSRS